MHLHDITIRNAGDTDRRALEMLAGLDSTSLRQGTHLVAEAGGVPVAALPIGGGRAIADPFKHTGTAVALLELRRAQLASSERRSPRRRRRLAAFLLRRPAAAGGC